VKYITRSVTYGWSEVRTGFYKNIYIVDRSFVGNIVFSVQFKLAPSSSIFLEGNCMAELGSQRANHQIMSVEKTSKYICNNSI
jgi:hypothetical protein